MNRFKFTRSFLFTSLAICAILFAACPNPADDGGDDEVETSLVKEANGVMTLRFTVLHGETRYFSLGTGDEITDPHSLDWDIAFENSRLIYINGGDTARALATGGYGAVWHTDKGFDETTPEDAVTDDPFYKTYNADVYRWTTNMTGVNRRRINVMTYAGYGNDNDYTAKGEKIDGLTEETCFDIWYKYNKKQFYKNGFDETGMMLMPPVFEVTNQVYIIRHGNGADQSKVEITEFLRAYATQIDTYTIKWQTFEE
jgi:hypothetical protein